MAESCIISSPIGKIFIETHEEVISRIEFLDEVVESHASDHHLLALASQELDAYFGGRLKTFSFPVKQPGTAFQQKIWTLLCEIPYGKTISYSELTRRYGDMKAIRAVASANGRNALAIVVPCHRVIGADGSLTGYAGGLPRKQKLLELEGVLQPPRLLF